MANSTTNLDTIANSALQKEVKINALFDAASQSLLFGRRDSTTSGLTWGYYGGNLNVSGTVTPIANGTVSLTDAATNYVEASSSGVVSANTSAFTGGTTIRLYQIITSGGAVTSYTDRRLGAGGSSGTTATQSIIIACSDETTALTTGTAKTTFRMPYAFNLSAVRASLTTAQTSGSIFTVDINESGTTVLSTKITIDNNEKTSTTAATAPVIGDASIADDAEITIDIDQVGNGTAAGLKVALIGTI
jgi:hypothetical protein